MFLHLSIILSMGGVWQTPSPGQTPPGRHPPPWQTPPPGQTPSTPQADIPHADSPSGQTSPWTDTHTPPTPRADN